MKDKIENSQIITSISIKDSNQSMLGGTGICPINISQTITQSLPTLFPHNPFLTYSPQTPIVPIMATMSENTAANKKHWE